MSNGIIEKNHPDADVAVKNIMDNDRKITLQENISMAGGIYDTNVNTLGFTLL